VKTYLPSIHLALDASAFDYKFDHLQSLNLVPSSNPLSPPSYQVVSSDESAKGVDLQARWKATRDFQLFFVSEYINQRYDSDVAADGTVLTGQPVGTPLWTAALGGDYYWRNVYGGTLDLMLSGTYTGAERCNSDSVATGQCLKTPAFDFGEATHSVNFKLGWDSPDRKWGVAFYVTNLFNNRYVTYLDLISATKLGTPAGQITPPRFYGIELSMHL
jgi:iron complex outermembrane receptor protein